MTKYIVFDKNDIEDLDADQLVVVDDGNGGRIVICSEKAFEEHEKFWGLVKGEDLVELQEGETK